MWKILCCAALFGVFVPPISTQNWDLDKMRQCLCLADVTGTFSASVPDNIMKDEDAEKYWYTETLDGEGDFYKIKFFEAYSCNADVSGSSGVMDVNVTFGGQLTRYSLSCLEDTQTKDNPTFSSSSNYHFVLDVDTGTVTVTRVSFSESFFSPNQMVQNTRPIGNAKDTQETMPIKTINFNIQLTMYLKYTFLTEVDLSSQISGLMRKGLSGYWTTVKNCLGEVSTG